jgi:hypothetical protein
MKNWFKANLNPTTQKLGMFDPYFEQYIVSDNDRSVMLCEFSISNGYVYVPWEGSNNEFAFDITSNSTWTISTPSANWVSLVRSSGNGSQSITINVQENNTSARIATFNVTSGCGITKQITIEQRETCNFAATITQ